VTLETVTTLADPAFLLVLYAVHRLGLVTGISLAKFEDFPLFTWLQGGVTDL